MKFIRKIASIVKINAVNIFIILLPVIDAITSLNERLHFLPFSLGAIVKASVELIGIFFLTGFYLIKHEKRKKFILLTSLLLVYYVLHLLFSGALDSPNSFLLDHQTVLKYLSLPFFTLLLFALYKNNKQNIKGTPTSIVISATLYSLFIILPTILNINYSSYYYTKIGSTGWYYAANELGPILLAHFFLVLQFMKSSEKRICYMITLVLCSASIIMLETKTAILSLLLILIIDFIASISSHDRKARSNCLILLLISVLMILHTQVFLKLTTLDLARTNIDASTVQINANTSKQIVSSNSDAKNDGKEALSAPSEEKTTQNLIEKVFLKADSLMSHRLTTTREIYFGNDLQIQNLFFGKTIITLSGKNKTAEIDYIDLTLHLGAVGFIIYIVTVIALFGKAFRDIPHNYAYREGTIFLILAAILAALAGHVLTSPSACLYLSLVSILPMMINRKEKSKHPPKKREKTRIDILGLHLNYGGTEQAIINQANMLCEDFDVRLVITYKLTEKPAFEVDKRVKIIYLTSLRPNREKLARAINEKNLKKLCQELVYSLRVLREKDQSMRRYVSTSDADIFISSRLEFHKILKKCAPDNSVLIGEEHTYSLNDKRYLRQIKKSCNGFVFFVCVSKEISEAYKKLLKKTKCVYIPNALEKETRDIKAKLDNKNIYTVGRLSPEKGFVDALKIIDEARHKDDKIKLHIIGDGGEKLRLEKFVEEKQLERNVAFYGFKDRSFIEKIAMGSSLFLSTSYEESFGTAVIEAGSFGIPAIVFDSAKGPLEIIKNHNNGIIIKNRDIKKASDAVVTLLDDRETLKKMGKNAQEKAKEFSFDSVKKLWYNLILESLGKTTHEN
ncbi:O-antigen ligase family protein [Candidatus Saccharibacteria bacterium]|nr:O-antigen ligase family protein [Candidatus Saccharibacteria bacterium]